jgi:hypothetical protein
LSSVGSRDFVGLTRKVGLKSRAFRVSLAVG